MCIRDSDGSGLCGRAFDSVAGSGDDRPWHDARAGCRQARRAIVGAQFRRPHVFAVSEWLREKVWYERSRRARLRQGRRRRVPFGQPQVQRHQQLAAHDLGGRGAQGKWRARRPTQDVNEKPRNVKSTRAKVEPRPGDPLITPALIAEHGLTADEFRRLVDMLGREPTFTELGIVSALWSEHCSYKHSRPLLKTLPTKAPFVLQGPGENAGVIAVGDGLAVAFKIESHNHPSAVEPYQGAATGVGGILRDVFTMGARPIAMLNSLRFGSLDHPRVRYLFAGVVKGIGDYGNSVGVPTIGGEVVFDPAYETNPLVNAMCVGVMHERDLIRAKAEGVGNPIIAVGARTGRDGIHGASFASEDLSHESDAKRPRVQVGDPFTEKLLLEASLELIKSGHIVAIQDMGAAGLTSSSAEMAARGDVSPAAPMS